MACPGRVHFSRLDRGQPDLSGTDASHSGVSALFSVAVS